MTQVGKKFLAEKKFSQALREMVRRNPSLKGIELKHVNDGVRKVKQNKRQKEVYLLR